MILNKFDINDFVKGIYSEKYLFLYDDVYVQGKIVSKIVSKKVFLYDLWKNKYVELHESQIKNISLYAVIE